MAEATAPSASRRRDRFWADLTGASDRWGRTILYGLLLSRVSLAPLLILVVLLHGAATGDWTGPGSIENFSGRIDQVDAGRILSAVIAAPLLETLLLVLLVGGIGFRLKAGRWATATFTGLAFIPLHGLGFGSLVVFPFFVLMAVVWYNWKQRGDGLGGFWIVVSLHAVANGSALFTSALFVN